jgi:hypothetical protein
MAEWANYVCIVHEISILNSRVHCFALVVSPWDQLAVKTHTRWPSLEGHRV